MKVLTTLLTILFISLLSSPSWSDTVSWNDLVERDELYYKKFSDVPFTGKVSGRTNSRFKFNYIENVGFKNGKKDGFWESYREDGQLDGNGTYKDGEFHGLWTWYHDNGQIQSKQNYKDGEEDGLLEYFNEDGSQKSGEIYKNGKFVETTFPPRITKIEGKYLCKLISSHQNYVDKTIFKKQNYDEEIKMEIFEDKVILNSPSPTMVGKMILDFERHSENIGLLYVEGFNLEDGFRNIMFSKNELTTVTIFTPNVFVSSYNCTLNF